MTERYPAPGADGFEWFDAARFGMFVHWDHASQQGLEISWPMVGGIFSLPASQRVDVERYNASASTFDPRRWDPADLAARARRAGMRYVVFTARHHSGYNMFDTALSDFGVMHSPYGRDITREFVDACRAEGLRIGLYYSLSDWHHPDYPAFRDEDQPYVFGSSPPLGTEEQAERFRSYLLGQLDELMTGYGHVDIVWFDGGWERPPAWWHPDEIMALLRDRQPDVLVNDRLLGHGDYATPEQFIPPTPPARRWETCMTMNESWAWNPDDTAYKSSRAIVHALCETASRGGNLLLNVSPLGDGSLPSEQIERLDAVSGWMEQHAATIHDTRPGLEPWQFYGPSTRSEPDTDGTERIHLFLLMRPYESITVRGLPVRRVRRATVVGTGDELVIGRRTGIIESLAPDPDGEITLRIADDQLDDLATVITLEIAPTV